MTKIYKYTLRSRLESCSGSTYGPDGCRFLRIANFDLKVYCCVTQSTGPPFIVRNNPLNFAYFSSILLFVEDLPIRVV